LAPNGSFMISMKSVEPIAKLVCKIMKLSLHFCEFILPEEYMCRFLLFVNY
jgi:hypothetical protein